ncbi:hypothetical protein EZS27_041792 [termite gut metagenome]|uniref:Uncharacterized protein n=1 Tax=termite gut metagenome TaxID=433724 RepID=A0A5J4PC44_9ZZZZ
MDFIMDYHLIYCLASWASIGYERRNTIAHPLLFPILRVAVGIKFKDLNMLLPSKVSIPYQQKFFHD